VFGLSLALQPLSLDINIVLPVVAERLPHVLVAKIFLVQQMICCCYMVVAVGLHAPDRVLLVKLKVFNQPLHELFVDGHLLETREKA